MAHPRSPFRSCGALAAALTVVLLYALGALLAWDFQLAELWAAEDGVIEWTQVALLCGAFALGARRLFGLIANGRPAAPDLLLTFLFGALLIGELDLDYRLFGISVLDSRFFRRPTVWLPYKLLAALVIGGAHLAVAAYAVRHKDQLWREARRLTAEPWGHLLLAGAAIFGFVQLFERRLNHWLLLPRNFLEESLELMAAFYFLLAMVARTFFSSEPSDRRQHFS